MKSAWIFFGWWHLFVNIIWFSTTLQTSLTSFMKRCRRIMNDCFARWMKARIRNNILFECLQRNKLQLMTIFFHWVPAKRRTTRFDLKCCYPVTWFIMLKRYTEFQYIFLKLDKLRFIRNKFPIKGRYFELKRTFCTLDFFMMLLVLPTCFPFCSLLLFDGELPNLCFVFSDPSIRVS